MVLTKFSYKFFMNNSISNKNLELVSLDWNDDTNSNEKQIRHRNLRKLVEKIDFANEFNNYILLTVPTRFMKRLDYLKIFRSDFTNN